MFGGRACRGCRGRIERRGGVREASRGRRAWFGAALLCAVTAQAVAPLSGTASASWLGVPAPEVSRPEPAQTAALGDPCAPPADPAGAFAGLGLVAPILPPCPQAGELPSVPLEVGSEEQAGAEEEAAEGHQAQGEQAPADEQAEAQSSEAEPEPEPAPVDEQPQSDGAAEPPAEAAAACTPGIEGVPCAEAVVACAQAVAAREACASGVEPLDTAVAALQGVVAGALSCGPEGDPADCPVPVDEVPVDGLVAILVAALGCEPGTAVDACAARCAEQSLPCAPPPAGCAADAAPDGCVLAFLECPDTANAGSCPGGQLDAACVQLPAACTAGTVLDPVEAAACAQWPSGVPSQCPTRRDENNPPTTGSAWWACRTPLGSGTPACADGALFDSGWHLTCGVLSQSSCRLFFGELWDCETAPDRAGCLAEVAGDYSAEQQDCVDEPDGRTSACDPDLVALWNDNAPMACQTYEGTYGRCSPGPSPNPTVIRGRLCAGVPNCPLDTGVGAEVWNCVWSGDSAAACLEAAARQMTCGGLSLPCDAIQSCPNGEACPSRPVTDCAQASATSQCLVADEWADVAGAVCDPDTINPHVSPCTPDPQVVDASLFALVEQAFCGQGGAPPCTPKPIRDAHACATWTDGSPALEGNCVVDATVEAACAAVTPAGGTCVLRTEPMASLLNCADLRAAATGACRDTRTACAAGNVDQCAVGLRQLTLDALCAAAAAGCFPQLQEDLDACRTNDAGCSAAAVLAQACRQTTCPPELLGLAPCLTAALTCANKPFLDSWVGRACENRTRNNACPKANPHVSVTGATITAGDTVTQVPYENGSPAYPYRSIRTAFDQISAGWFVSPAKVAPGSYREALQTGASGAELRAVPDGSGVVTITGENNPGLTLSGTRRVSLQGISVTSSHASGPIAGPVVSATVTGPSGRRLVGQAVRYTVTDAVDTVAAPEPLGRQLILSSPFQLDPANMRISAVVDGVAVTPVITRAGDDVVVEFGQAAEVPVPPATEAWVTPAGWRGTAEITVVATSGMRLRAAARIVGAETGVRYRETTPSGEVRFRYATNGELPDGESEPGAVTGPAPTATTAPAPGPLPGPAGRLSGEDRAATAAAVSSSSFGTGVERVYVASGSGYADALAAGPAAGRAKAPVLLVERDRLPDSTRAEIERLSPQRLVVLGGDAAVGADVERRLRALAPRLDRISGGDRYGTAAAIAAGHFAAGVPVVYIASGEGFADALAAGPAAAAQGGPVLLVRRDAIPEATASQLRRLAPGRIVVLGGTQAVSDLVATQLRLFTAGEVRRLRGPDRYGTAAAVTAHAFTRRVDTIYVATGASFADALAGAPAAVQDGAPLLLVEGDRLPAPAAAELDRLRPRRIVILGGERSVSLRLERELRSYETARA